MTGYAAAHARADYRAMITAYGEDIALTRGATTKTVKARLLHQASAGQVGSRTQAARLFLVLAADVVATPAFPVPFQAKLDRLVWNGKTLTITRVDDTKRRVGGELIAYEIEAIGA